MSQIDKFNKRLGKMTKEQVDEEVVKDTELKNSTIENVGKKVANRHGMTTEDIFMIIARDGVSAFTKMWNNSMENVIKETIHTEVKEIIREVIQDELSQAVSGFMKGLAMSQMPTVEKTIQDAIEFELKPMIEETIEEKPKELKDLVDRNTTYEEAIQILVENGFKPTIGSHWVKRGGRFTTLYSNFMKEHKGEKSAWPKFIRGLMEKTENDSNE